MEKLDYLETVNQIVAKLNNKTDIVLATTNGKTVSARTVYYINAGLCIYFVTSKAYRKFKDIMCNSNVAFCLDNVQIEGTATNLGHPNKEENKYMQEKVGSNAGMKQFLKYKNTVLIKVDITSVEMWITNRRLFLDVHKQEAYIK